MELRCEADGIPLPTVFWQKDSIPLDIDADSRLSQTPGGSLRIRGVVDTDSGDYLCLVSNDAGTDSRYFTVAVKGRPILLLLYTFFYLFCDSKHNMKDYAFVPVNCHNRRRLIFRKSSQRKGRFEKTNKLGAGCMPVNKALANLSVDKILSSFFGEPCVCCFLE